MLTASEVKNATPGRYADGEGLHLLVRPMKGARGKRLTYRRTDKLAA